MISALLHQPDRDQLDVQLQLCAGHAEAAKLATILTSTLNYTWAHSIDTASDGLDFVPNASQPDDSFNPHAERASSNFDVRQHLQWYWNYNLPKFKTATWISNGWGLDGMFNFASGQPLYGQLSL